MCILYELFSAKNLFLSYSSAHCEEFPSKSYSYNDCCKIKSPKESQTKSKN